MKRVSRFEPLNPVWTAPAITKCWCVTSESVHLSNPLVKTVSLKNGKINVAPQLCVRKVIITLNFTFLRTEKQKILEKITVRLIRKFFKMYRLSVKKNNMLGRKFKLLVSLSIYKKAHKWSISWPIFDIFFFLFETASKIILHGFLNCTRFKNYEIHLHSIPILSCLVHHEW